MHQFCMRRGLAMSLSALFVVGFAAGQTYTVTNLGTLGGSGNSVAYGLSENGYVVGQSNGQAFIWSSGSGMTGLNGLGGSSTVAYGVNSAGRAVGRADVSGLEYHAVLWDNSVNATDLGSAGQFSEAKAINKSSTIAGTANFLGFRKTYGGSMETLPTLDGITVGNAINSVDVVAGGSDDSGNVRHAYTWSSGPTLNDYGVQASADYSIATGINGSGLTVGYSSFMTTFGAWVYDGGFTPLAGLFTYENRALGVNDNGDIVGWSWTSSNGNDSKAVVWRSGTTSAVDLNSVIPGFESDWVLTTAYATNNSGQIVGVGKFNGETRGYLLNPVPEPASLAVLGLGVAFVRRRQKVQAKSCQ